MKKKLYKQGMKKGNQHEMRGQRLKRLVVYMNLLFWYNELTDTLDLNAPNFPKKTLNKIKTFGNCSIEFIDEKKTIFVRTYE
jgi:hypothetical protein